MSSRSEYRGSYVQYSTQVAAQVCGLEQRGVRPAATMAPWQSEQDPLEEQQATAQPHEVN